MYQCLWCGVHEMASREGVPGTVPRLTHPGATRGATRALHHGLLGREEATVVLRGDGGGHDFTGVAK